MNFFEKRKYKKMIFRAFKAGKIYKEYKQNNSNKILIYPRIHSIRLLHGYVEYVFTLINGMDPDIIKKNEYVFKQFFGKNIEIIGDLKKFILNVYQNTMPTEVKYDLDTIMKYTQGYKLPIVAGLDIRGQYTTYDMVKHPHLLIAGETGSGKSTQLRSILTTLINTMPSNKLHLYLADLKRSEFHLFRDIEHVKSLSIRSNDLKSVLYSIKTEMEQRGDMLDRSGVAHIDDLQKKLPYILVCIDEVGLLRNEKSIMNIIEDISSIGRSLGVFLILSMQRPDSKVLDGKLKLNLTVRMGFRSADRINANIIGTPGAEEIKNNGRFLLKLNDLVELQVPNLSVKHARSLLKRFKVVKPLNQQNKGITKKYNVKNDVIKEVIKLGVIDYD